MIDIDFTIELILKDPAASRWIKDSLIGALKRDPVDAINDAEVLAKVLRHKVRNIQTMAVLQNDLAELRGVRS